MHPRIAPNLRRVILMAIAIVAITFIPASGLVVEVCNRWSHHWPPHHLPPRLFTRITHHDNFFLDLLHVRHVVKVGFVVAERVLYTPCIGASLLFAAAAAAAVGSGHAGTRRFDRRYAAQREVERSRGRERERERDRSCVCVCVPVSFSLFVCVS